MKLAVIPARGGSKRIPRKNIKDFCGKPMLAWSIDAARKSGLFDYIVVSTDDPEVAEVALKHGADVPFLRPSNLADDLTATRPVVIHAIDKVMSLFSKPEYVCCLYATAPFVTAKDLISGFEKLVIADSDFAFTVAEYPSPIQRAMKICPNGRVAMINPEYRSTRSQDLERAFHDAGQFYWGRTDAFLTDLPTFSSHSVPIVLPSYRVQDIDTPEDWLRAEYMFKAINSSSVSL